MKRTDTHISATRGSVTKAKKEAPVKTAKTTVSAATTVKKQTAPAAEKPLKNVRSKPAAKVSAPPATKTKKPVALKEPAPVKPAAGNKKTADAKEKTVKISNPVTAAKNSGAVAPKSVKPAVKSAAQSLKIAPPLPVKTVKSKKEPAAAPKTVVKKPETAKTKVEIVVSPVKAKSKKNSPATENKAAAKTATAPKAKLNAEKIQKKVEAAIPAKNQKPPIKSAAAEKRPAKNEPPANQNSKVKAAKGAPKTVIIAPLTKPPAKKTIAAATEKKAAKAPAKKVEQKIEIVVPPIAAKPVKKKLKPIGSAVVRGKSGKYDFEVFPLDADLKDGSAIYVISKRITDKSGRGHHKFVCIGQTESLLGEIKRHKKDKCIKQHKANVICLLREESAANRLKIETDLREAHTIACNQK